MSGLRELPSHRTPNGKHDAYCRVCWNPIYASWVDDSPPDHSRCPFGDYTAQSCPDSTAKAELQGLIARLQREGVLPP